MQIIIEIPDEHLQALLPEGREEWNTANDREEAIRHNIEKYLYFMSNFEEEATRQLYETTQQRVKEILKCKTK